LVIFFLARSHPLFNLRLQAEGFGRADRLFQALKLTWETAFNPGTDVMELISEFYFGDGSFLRNSLDLNLGKTQAGRVVGDVILPKWANVKFSIFIYFINLFHIGNYRKIILNLYVKRSLIKYFRIHQRIL
jgi:hypothetical protein